MWYDSDRFWYGVFGAIVLFALLFTVATNNRPECHYEPAACDTGEDMLPGQPGG